ncbi:hypothetical protein ACFSJY_12730 [Thalassotalea euphylliae]|uniref:hypothetical protein n=1 Tax=Thalassotalea euphylliae TaxID=1655234 RepID=UPI00363C7C55
MLLSLFKQSPCLDESTTLWILDTFEWAITNLDCEEFKHNALLVLPTGDFYPGKVSSIEEMAQSVFDKTLEYAGLKNWPIKLVSPALYHQNPQYHKMPKLEYKAALRGAKADVFSTDFTPGASNTIYVSYNPNQINQPQDLIASYAQAFAAIVIAQKGIQPPGGNEFMPQAIDLVASFMGFGIMFANTAYQFKGGCGSCYNKYANREVALPENEMVYCLALFSVLKNIAVKDVTPHLKSHLRGTFKKSVKELTSQRKTEQFNMLSSNPN